MIECYAVEEQERSGTERVFGPYGYPGPGAALDAAKDYARKVRGVVVAQQFEFSDSELVDDFRGEAHDYGEPCECAECEGGQG